MNTTPVRITDPETGRVYRVVSCGTNTAIYGHVVRQHKSGRVFTVERYIQKTSPIGQRVLRIYNEHMQRQEAA